MATFSWAQPNNGDWTTAANWAPATVPNDAAADVFIDAPTDIRNGYTVTLPSGATETVKSLFINATNNRDATNTPQYNAANFELDGTLVFASGSPGDLRGSLQTNIFTAFGSNAEVVNIGTVDGFWQVQGNLLLTGTNGVYVTGWLQANGGTITIDTSSIAEMTGNVLFDGIFDARGPGSQIDLGGPGNIVNIGTIEGPPAIPDGWTEIFLVDPTAKIREYDGSGDVSPDGSGYFSIEKTLREIGSRGTLDVLAGGNWTSTNTLTVNTGGALKLHAGTITTASLVLNSGGVLDGAAIINSDVVNNGTIIADTVLVSGDTFVANTLDFVRSLTGTGTVGFAQGATAAPAIELHTVGTRQTIVMNGTNTLRLDDPAAFAGTIVANPGDRIVLEGLSATRAVLNAGTLVVSNGFTVVDRLAIVPTATNEAFSVNGSIITVGTANFHAPSITLQNDDGSVGIWQLNGATLEANGQVGANPGPTWHIQGRGDFYRDGASSILWQNDNGAVAVWEMNDISIVKAGVVDANPGPSWHIQGTGDFYRDGASSILWQNDDGSVAIWEMNGTSIVKAGVVDANPGSAWHIKGTGDFYGDGATDILWQNDNGAVAVWEMNGTSIVKAGVVDANPGPSWHIQGTGDFYRDGASSILWQNDNGAVAIWEMNGTSIVKAGVVDANPGPAWHIVDTGDYYADGASSILWQNDNGAVAVWEMNGASIVKADVINVSPGSNWNIVGKDTMQFIHSGASGETIQASPALSEAFVFTNTAAGDHTIAGFNPVQDSIELSAAQFASFADVQAATSATAGGSVIDLGNGRSLQLTGVSPDSLHASNFALG